MKRSLAILLSILAMSAFSDEARIYWENDFPFDDDADYSNGLKVEYRQGRLAYFVQQNMYTPGNIRIPYQYGEHPYAGYLGAGMGIEWDTQRNERLFRLTYFELHTGTTGPHSGAEWTQKHIHKIVGAHEPQGWDSQIPNKWQIQGLGLFGYEYVLLGNVDEWNLRVSEQVGAHVGTLQIAGENRANLKFGYGNDHGIHNNNIETRDPRAKRWSAYFIVGNETKYWVRNVFLDGLGDGGPSVDREKWTTALKTGLEANYKHFSLGTYCLFNTREYKTQKQTPNYMTFCLGYIF